MYLVIDDMDENVSFHNIDSVRIYIKFRLQEQFHLDGIPEKEKNRYLASVDVFFLYDMKPELTPFFDRYDCYLSDLFSIYKQIM